MKVLLGALGFCTVVTGSTNTPNGTDESHFLRKRWYSVPEYPGKAQATDPFLYPWPVVCQHPFIQPVYYCFRDVRSAKNLGRVVNEAIAKWGHAMSVTALRFELDPRAKDNPNVPCSQLGGDLDALVISDESIDDPNPQTVKDQFYSSACVTQTTVGYAYLPKVPFRNHLQFCELPPWDPGPNMDLAIRSMTHELGHALGLQPEHQGPDRGNYMWVEYRNIDGYDSLADLVMKDPLHRFPEDMDQVTRVKAVYTDDVFATDYFPECLPFLPGDRFDKPENADRWEAYEFSLKFDFESIMMYDSTMGRSDKAVAQNQKVIMRKPDKSAIWMGGSKQPGEWSISEVDIARVATLYDAHMDECEKAKKGDVWTKAGAAGPAPKALKVKIRGVFEGVVDAPRAVRKRDEI